MSPHSAPRSPARMALKIVVWLVGVIVLLVLLFILFEYVAPRLLGGQF